MPLTPEEWGAFWSDAPDRAEKRVDAAAALLGDSLGLSTAANILTRLTRRSGDLLDSVKVDVVRRGSVVGIVLTVGEDSPAGAYAKVQDEGSGYLPGGVIRPKNGQYLAIPMPIGRGTSGPQSPRQLPEADTLWIPRVGGGFYVIHGGQLLFVLVPEVRLLPKRYAMDAFEDVAGAEAPGELAAIVEVLQ